MILSSFGYAVEGTLDVAIQNFSVPDSIREKLDSSEDAEKAVGCFFNKIHRQATTITINKFDAWKWGRGRNSGVFLIVKTPCRARSASRCLEEFPFLPESATIHTFASCRFDFSSLHKLLIFVYSANGSGLRCAVFLRRFAQQTTQHLSIGSRPENSSLLFSSRVKF